ncbi:CGNR zinc finger domain-containing protein [Amycolatopsis circi]|uniref:CGNR zinc finger domain-containing protein n=1 Tax=Amycolatopsis circi TaxID=871959 RepID=UPI001FCA1671|nr:CGNR zinc finger domain-containing protein [Amycolatopsis circi]
MARRNRTARVAGRRTGRSVWDLPARRPAGSRPRPVPACAAPDCDGVFVDTSRAGSRYCMPDLCGNRVSVANHRARSRERS